MKTRSLPRWGWLLLLMLVVCLPRVTIDAYLPSLPAMADALHGTDAQLQLTLTLYMVGYALSMLASGPLSDRYGRRPVLLGGLCSTWSPALPARGRPASRPSSPPASFRRWAAAAER